MVQAKPSTTEAEVVMRCQHLILSCVVDSAVWVWGVTLGAWLGLNAPKLQIGIRDHSHSLICKVQLQMEFAFLAQPRLMVAHI